MYRIQTNVLKDIFYKHIQYNYIGITTFRDLFIFNHFFKNLRRTTNNEPTLIWFNKIVS